MKLVLLLVALTAVNTAHCRDQDSNIEALLFPDEPANTDITGEDQLFPNEQVDDTYLGETQLVPIGPENQNIDEEVQQMKENYEMGSVSDHRSSMTKERKRCIPTPLCTRAGGYCVKKSRDCNGMLDSNGCRGSKKCKCCIPDDIICGLAPTTVEPTTTSVTTTPAPTTTTPVTTTPAPTTTTPDTTTTTPTTTTVATTTTTTDTTTTTTPTTTTAATTTTTTDTTTTTTPTTTTVATTTTTTGCNVSHTWLSVGADRFVSFPLQTMNWADARNVCRQHCLDLYELKDASAVSQHLDDTFSIGGGFEHWLGGRGNGTHQIWLSGNVVPDDAPWNSGQKNSVAIDDCMFLHGHRVSGVLGGFSCDHTSSMRPLCG